jgi:hypothetical protein
MLAKNCKKCSKSFVARKKNHELSTFTYLCVNKVQFLRAVICYDPLLAGCP